MLIKLTQENYHDVLNEAVNVLVAGGIIAYPTETLYGLGAKYDVEQALERIFMLKNRPEEKALTLITGESAQLSLIVEFIPPIAQELMNSYWPGPLTLVFKAKKGIPRSIVLNNTVAVRIPGDSFALRLARAVSFPFTATSANISNMPAAQDARTVVSYFGDKLDLIIDGGKTLGEPPSTIVDVTGEDAKVIREGAVKIERFLQEKLFGRR
jgi:L-threonylcarbamoyladenylate synthase